MPITPAIPAVCALIFEKKLKNPSPRMIIETIAKTTEAGASNPPFEYKK